MSQRLNPISELKSTNKRSDIVLGEKKLKLSPDWQM
jgi:hypothetical protein